MPVSDEDFENIMAGLREAKAFIEGTADPATCRVHRPAVMDVRAKDDGIVMSLEDARQWAMTECDAWNARDLERIIDRYAENVTPCSPAVVTRMDRPNGVLRGKAEVRDYFAIGLQAPNLHFELLDVLAGVNALCMIFRRETGVVVSDVFDFDAQRQVVRLLACYGERS